MICGTECSFLERPGIPRFFFFFFALLFLRSIIILVKSMESGVRWIEFET